ncbi:helix-turn-helix domain-containing protein [Labilibacter sediminis]|nr:helix-turn-helix domain-containing protein [Labilibacter sediminis]
MAETIEDIFHSKVVPQPVPFEIISFESIYKRYADKDSHIYQCHRIQFNALLIIISGKGTHNIDCKEYLLQPGTIIPLVKEQVHCFNKNLEVEGLIITFTNEFISENTSERDLFHFLQLYHSPVLQIDPENIRLLTPYTDLLFREQESGSMYLKEELMKNIFLSLLIQLKRLTPLEHHTVDNQRFRDFILFKQLIIKEFTNTHNAKDYANSMGISYKYLNDICKEFSHKTAKAFIDSWLILEIKRNLSEKMYSIKEIAFNTGFDEPTNLIRFFKKHTGETPGDFLFKL